METREIILEKHPLQTDTKYAYCIKCSREQKKIGMPIDALPKLIYTKVKLIEIFDEKNKNESIDEYWFCPKCRTRTTIDDFVSAYCTKPKSRDSKE